MADRPRFIRVFLSSPGDVADERALALKVIEQLPYDPLLRGQIMIEVVAWDKEGAGTPLLATMTPQEAINQGLPKPSECDIVVVIFWSRMGTPLPEEYVKPEEYHFSTAGDLADWRYLSGTEWEYVDAVQSARKTGKPLVTVYRRMEDPIIKLSAPDFMQKREQWQRIEDFFGTFVNPDGSIRQGYNAYKTPDDFKAQFETHLKVLVKRLLSEVSPPVKSLPKVVSPEESAPLWHGSPFPGLRAFTPDDAPIFFGRGRETDELIKKVSENRFVAVVGASGSGKSSLVAAGLLPRLKDRAIVGSQDWLLPHLHGDERREWTGVRFTPGELSDNPFVSLAVRLAPMVGQNAREVAEALASDPKRLGQLCLEALAGQPDWAEVLLFIDQFEELFTLARNDILRGKFVAMLSDIAHIERVRTVVTLRADFYHRCVEHEALAEVLRAGSFPLAAPGERALYEMITRPAERAGLTYENADLPERILADTGQEPGALALLAYTLDELYQDCCDSNDGVLSRAAYEALGGVQGAIGERAESVFAGLSPAAQAMLTHVFRELVEVDERGTATRQRAPLARFEGNDAAWTLLEKFTDARLLTAGGTGAEAVIEVAHEALFRHWKRLAEWIETAQDDLRLLRQVRLAAAEWDANRRDRAFLWPDERLKPVYAMVERLQPRLDEITQDFIRPEAERLLAELENVDTPHQRRSAIGERLAAIGDPRSGVGLRADGLPDIVWCAVPGGEIELEDDKGAFTVQPFYIAKYPITFIQFQAFLDDPEGFENDTWWAGLTEKYRKQEMAAQRSKFDNHPRDSVSWYQAIAFCRWLTIKLPKSGWPQGSIPIREDWQIRLPTEWEWQQAATGGNPANEYPWGSEWDNRRANTRDAGLSRATAVGMYPQGAALPIQMDGSQLEVLDLSGNVWEWCLNDCDNPENIGLSSSEYRVLRGGAFDDVGNVKHFV